MFGLRQDGETTMQATQEMTHSDLVVRVQPSPEEAEGLRLQEALGAQPGVSRVQIHSRENALVIVDFDPRAISPRAILHCVQAQGHVARLLGV